MKRTSKTKKGFTLVELIVVLVILAILAAMLIPALTGYIKRAREEKDYQFAASVLTAAQSAATYQYSLAASKQESTIKQDTSAGRGMTVADLIGTTSKDNWTCSFSANSQFVITGGTVTINDNTYSWDGASWTIQEA